MSDPLLELVAQQRAEFKARLVAMLTEEQNLQGEYLAEKIIEFLDKEKSE